MINPARNLSAIDQVSRLLSRSHLFCLLCYLAGLMLRLPDATGALLLLTLGALAAESLPRRLHRRALPELLILIASLLALSQIPRNGEALGLLLRSFIACWILIPSRLGMLRLLPVLLIADAGLSPRLSPAFIVLLPVGFSALMLDTWLRCQMRDLPGVICNHHPRVSPLRWLLAALPICCLLALFAGQQLHGQLRHLGPHDFTRIGLPSSAAADGGASELATDMRIGDHRWVSKNPMVMARVIYEADDLPAVAYLRALCVPDIGLEGNQVTWSSLPTAPLRLPERPQWYESDDDSAVRVIRMRGATDVVLRPDGAAWLALANCLGDEDGNCYQAGIGLSNASYTAQLGHSDYPNTSTRLGAYRQLPPDLLIELRKRIPEIEQWSMLSAEEASRRIVNLLRRRCTYATEDLPEPPPVMAGSLLQFIDGPEERRIGHCQYFASACTVLLRASGFATRPVVGYTSGEIEEDSIIFRALNAHAWLEVLDAKRRWIRVDPTPPAALAVDAEQLAAWKQELENQGQILPGLDQPSSWPWRRWVLICGLLLLGTMVFFLRRRQRSESQGNAHQRRLQQQREALLNLASAFGIEIRHSSTITQLVIALEERSGIAMQETLQRYLAARFASRGEIPQWPMAELRAVLQKRRSGKQAKA